MVVVVVAAAVVTTTTSCSWATALAPEEATALLDCGALVLLVALLWLVRHQCHF